MDVAFLAFSNIILSNPLRLLVHCSILALDGVVAEVTIDTVPLHLDDQIYVATKIMNPPVWYDCVSLFGCSRLAAS